MTSAAVESNQDANPLLSAALIPLTLYESIFKSFFNEDKKYSWL